jgi:Cation/multidrug efflux pump
VNHINQFTSVTLFFNMKPGYTVGQATDFVEKSAKEILPPDVREVCRGRL